MIGLEHGYYVPMEFAVTLQPSMIDKIIGIAKNRQVQKRGRGQVNQKISDRSDLSVEIDGLKGEYATAIIYHVAVNEGFEADDGWDLVIFGYKVQVKYTPYPTGVLLFPTLAHFTADLAILAVGHGPHVRLAGWIPQEEFNPPYKPKAAGSKSWFGYGIPQNQLYRMPGFTP